MTLARSKNRKTVVFAWALAALLAALVPSRAAQEATADKLDNTSHVKPDAPGTRQQSKAPQPLRSLIGKIHEGKLDLDGWQDQGGGLLAAPVWFNYFRRADGAYLVLINWEQPRKPGSKYATFQVTDVLVTPPVQSGLELSFDCRPAKQNVFRKIIAIIRPDPRHPKKWWRDVKQAWAVGLDTGRLKPIAPTGIECVNEGWGL